MSVPPGRVPGIVKPKVRAFHRPRGSLSDSSSFVFHLLITWTSVIKNIALQRCVIKIFCSTRMRVPLFFRVHI